VREISDSVYLDDGYGINGYADIYVLLRGNTILKMTVEGMTEKEMEKEIMKIIENCPAQKRYDCCAEELSMEDYEELEKEVEEKGEEFLCGDCRWLNMCLCLFETYPERLPEEGEEEEK